METNIDEKYLYYAKSVLEGKIKSCETIKLACKRYLDWFNREDIEFRPEKGDRVVNFISKLKHYTGKSNGKFFVLEDWQKWVIYSIFGFYWKGTRKRVIHNVYIEIARKNGKSALISAICLYCMMADGENGAEVDVVANSRQQAKILYDMCRTFGETIDPRGKYLKGFRDRIKFDYTKSHIQVLSSDAATLDGYNASMFAQDEVHEAKDDKLYNVMKTSQGMRENPLAVLITTAGFNLFGFCYQIRSNYIDILHGLKTDDSQFSAIFTLDKDDDWTDESNWIKANPNLDITVSSDYLKEQVNSAKVNPSLETNIRTKNFNQWLSSSDVWLPNDILVESSRKLTDDDFVGRVCNIGVDLAAVSDFTAVSLMTRNNDGKYLFLTKYYIPSSCLEGNPNSEKYKEWKKNNLIVVCPGNCTDYDYILTDILKWRDKGIMIEKVSYDSYNATQFAINATEEGLPLQPFSQSLWHFNLSTKEFERQLKQNNVIIDNNEITRWCFSNVALKYDHNDNCKPIKGGTEMQKIDGVIAMLEALGGYLETPHYNNMI